MAVYSLIPKAYSRCFGNSLLNVSSEYHLEFIHIKLSYFLFTKLHIFFYLEPFLNSKEVARVKCHDGFIRESLGQICPIFCSGKSFVLLQARRHSKSLPVTRILNFIVVFLGVLFAIINNPILRWPFLNILNIFPIKT